MTALLDIENLRVSYRASKGWFEAVRGASLTLNRGETLGVVGESGCGKSTVALAVIGLLPKDESRITDGDISFEGQSLTRSSDEQMRALRGRRIAMIFQDPFTSLNPVMTIGRQIAETLALDGQTDIRSKTSALLDEVQLPSERVAGSYPHQLSGGQRQRVMIAMAIARNPDLLLADEPTTALDVTIQSEIIGILRRIQSERGMAMLFVTHNIGLVRSVAKHIAVMYAGQIVEQGATEAVLSNPKHPYSAGLLRSIPKIGAKRGALPILPGRPPELATMPSGCAFHPRCEKRFEICDQKDPEPRQVSEQAVRCHLYES